MSYRSRFWVAWISWLWMFLGGSGWEQEEEEIMLYYYIGFLEFLLYIRIFGI